MGQKCHRFQTALFVAGGSASAFTPPPPPSGRKWAVYSRRISDASGSWWQCTGSRVAPTLARTLTHTHTHAGAGRALQGACGALPPLFGFLVGPIELPNPRNWGAVQPTPLSRSLSGWSGAPHPPHTAVWSRPMLWAHRQKDSSVSVLLCLRVLV